MRELDRRDSIFINIYGKFIVFYWFAVKSLIQDRRSSQSKRSMGSEFFDLKKQKHANLAHAFVEKTISVIPTK